MENNILSKNLSFIQKYNEKLVENILNISDLEGNFEIKPAKSEDNILFKDGVPVDDHLDPVWGSLEKYNKIENKDFNSITVIYGLGLGYPLKEFTKRHTGKIIIYEPDLEILRITLELVDLSEELAREKVVIANTYQDLEQGYYQLFFTHYKLNIVISDYYLDSNSGDLEKFKKKIEEIHGTFQSNFKNAMQKSSTWTIELLKNIPFIADNQDLHVLKNRFKGKTAVIISAGPSLDKNIEELKPYRDSVIVFCVGTAFQAAIKHGIIPDFAVVIETSPNSLKQLDIPEIKDVSLIIGTNSYNRLFSLKPKRIFNYHANKTPAAKWLGYMLDVPVESYEVAGTVSITSLYSAKMLGCDKIILIGQDLAYTNNQCYSKSTLYGSYKLDESKKIISGDNIKESLNTHEERLLKHKENLNKDLCTIKGINGEILTTRPDFFLFTKYFEEIARNYSSELRLINATKQGAFLEGFEHLSFTEALQQCTYNQPVNIENTLKDSKIGTKEIKKRKKIVQTHMNEAIKKYNLIKNLIKESLEHGLIELFDEDGLKSYQYVKENFSKYWEKCQYASLTPEEVQFVREFPHKQNQIYMHLKEKTDNLFENDADSFNQKFILLKHNYLKLDRIIGEDFLLKNVVLRDFLSTNNALKENRLENHNEHIYRCLYKSLITAFVNMSLFYPLIEEKISSFYSQNKQVAHNFS